jgi:hypothetical protein
MITNEQVKKTQIRTMRRMTLGDQLSVVPTVDLSARRREKIPRPSTMTAGRAMNVMSLFSAFVADQRCQAVHVHFWRVPAIFSMWP